MKRIMTILVAAMVCISANAFAADTALEEMLFEGIHYNSSGQESVTLSTNVSGTLEEIYFEGIAYESEEPSQAVKTVVEGWDSDMYFEGIAYGELANERKRS